MMIRITEWFKTFFLVLFIVELLVFIAVAKHIGFIWALLLIIASSLLGIKILRGQFSVSVTNLRRDMESGYFASNSPMGSALRTLSGILLVMPGLVTSVIGLLCLIPALKARFFRKHIDQNDTIEGKEVEHSTTTYTKSSRVLEGEFVREKPEDKE